MKRIVTLLVLLLAFGFSRAQDVKMTLSTPIPSNRTANMKNACRIGDRIFMIQAEGTRDTKLTLKIFDANDLHLIKEKVFKDRTCKGIKDCIDYHFDYVRTLFFKNSFMILFESFEKDTDIHWLFAQKIDEEGNFDGDLIKIDKIEAKKRSKAGTFGIEVSEDSTKFVVVSKPAYDKYAGEKYGFKVYDAKLNNLSNMALALPELDKNVALIDYYLGNNGKIYILNNITLEKKQKEKGSADHYYSIFTVDPADQSISEYKIDLPKMNVEDCALKIDNDRGKILCSGFYSDVKSNSYTGKDLDGFFFMTVDIKTKNVENTGFKKIDKKLAATLMARKKVKDAGISKSFEIRKMINRPDGTTTMIAENRFVEVVTTYSYSNGHTTTTTTYYYYRKNIFVINIDRDGQVTSLTDIPKEQRSTNDNGFYSSFLAMEKDDKLILIYNDHPDNLDVSVKTLRDVTTMYNPAKAILTQVEILKDGSYTKKKLMDNKESKLMLVPEQGFRVADGEYIVPTLVPIGGCGCSCLMFFTKKKMGFAKLVID